MAKKKLSDVNAVAQLGDNDFITCIMSNGEVVKVKKSDLMPLATSSSNGLMDKNSFLKLNNAINFNLATYRKFYIINSISDQGTYGIVSATNYNSTAMFVIANGVAGGGNTSPISLHYNPLIITNQSIAAMRIYKRGSKNIIEIILSKEIPYGGFSFHSLYKQIPTISTDVDLAYNPETDTNLINGVIATNV